MQEPPGLEPQTRYANSLPDPGPGARSGWYAGWCFRGDLEKGCGMTVGLCIEPTNATLGAIVTGVRLDALTAAQFERIEAAFHDHAVLIFPGQHLDDDDQAAFGRRFGELSIEGQTFTNAQRDGTVRPPKHPVVQLLRGSEGWHTDSSFLSISAKASILSARKVPVRGGETGWADMRAAWDALDPALRDRVQRLHAYHSLAHSQSRVGQDADDMAQGLAQIRADSQGETGPSELETEVVTQDAPTPEPPLRPLVKVHPATGRPALFVGRHAYGIPGLSPDASRKLLEELIDFACRPPRVLEHRWEVGDTVIWDNRCVVHRARPWDLSEPRAMFHVRVAGDPVTERAA